jgi:hypothetical protein
LKYAGKDATAVYEPIHPLDTLGKYLPADKHLGSLDAQDAKQIQDAQMNRKKTKDELRVEEAVKSRPPLGEMLCLQDLEDVARDIMSYKTNAYYSSAADDTISMCLCSRLLPISLSFSTHGEFESILSDILPPSCSQSNIKLRSIDFDSRIQICSPNIRLWRGFGKAGPSTW